MRACTPPPRSPAASVGALGLVRSVDSPKMLAPLSSLPPLSLTRLRQTAGGGVLESSSRSRRKHTGHCRSRCQMGPLLRGCRGGALKQASNGPMWHLPTRSLKKRESEREEPGHTEPRNRCETETDMRNRAAALKTRPAWPRCRKVERRAILWPSRKFKIVTWGSRTAEKHGLSLQKSAYPRKMDY